MPTLDDVARKAGVSKSTASRALNGSTLIAPATIERVRGVADELGFVVNRVARLLARGRTGIVAVVVPTLENAYFTPIIGGAQERALEADVQLTVAVNRAETADDFAALARLAGQVDGFLIATPQGAAEDVARFAAAKPTVMIDREIDGVSSVVADTATAFARIARSFVDAGHRRIAFIGGPAGSWQNAQRLRAVRDIAAGTDATIELFGPVPPTFAAGAGLADAIADSGATALVPYATAIGLGLYVALTARGTRIPDDVSLSIERPVAEAIGLDHVPWIDVDGAAIGRAAMAALGARLAQFPAGADEPARLRLPVRVREG